MTAIMTDTLTERRTERTTERLTSVEQLDFTPRGEVFPSPTTPSSGMWDIGARLRVKQP